MLQRKQTLYLFFATICFILCAFMPLGYLQPLSMGVSSTINSIGVVDGNTGALSYPYFALPMFFLALNALQSVVTIFIYKNRKSQALLCLCQIASIIVAIIVSAALIYINCIDGKEVTYQPAFALSLPIVAMIFILLAHKGIMDDERLIRSIDRIR